MKLRRTCSSRCALVCGGRAPPSRSRLVSSGHPGDPEPRYTEVSRMRPLTAQTIIALRGSHDTLHTIRTALHAWWHRRLRRRRDAGDADLAAGAHGALGDDLRRRARGDGVRLEVLLPPADGEEPQRRQEG